MKISNDNPNYFLTSVTHKRLPVFLKTKLKRILTCALNEARTSSGIKIFGYVIMPDHYHIITDSSKKPSEVLRFFNGISARRVIDYLKKSRFVSSLRKLRQRTKRRNYKYSLWQHHPNVFRITSERTFCQKLRYIHQNRVKEGLVRNPDDYLFLSSKIWNRRPSEAEPLQMDIKELEWRRYKR